MSLDLGQRLHAWGHNLFRSGDAAEAQQLYNDVANRLHENGLASPEGREVFVDHLVGRLCATFEISRKTDAGVAIHKLVARMFDFEGWFVLPDIDWNKRRSISDYWAIRDALAIQKSLLIDFEATETVIVEALYQMTEPLAGEPSVDAAPDGITIPTSILHTTPNLAASVEQMMGAISSEEAQNLHLFARLDQNLTRNLIRASGGNPDDPSGFTKTPRWPTDAKETSPAALVETYLAGTPLCDLFEQPVKFTIPTETRYSHMHCVGGSGHGKTQTLQYLIANDLEAVAKGERTVVVIDSQGDLIENISNLAEFAPGGPLHDRITIIDPTDVEYPVSLNMFDVGTERLQGYEMLERERLTNSILELYDFVLGSLLDAGMTQKQSVIFRYVTRLMLHIPGATIHTLRELMEPDAEKKFAEHIAKLSGSARHFFDTEFAGKEFKQTKQQVLRRLWGILENQTFERMFSHPKSKLDMFTEMNQGRVILINTAKDLLKEQGTQIFGRFFIALITQASQERATLSVHKRLSTMVYVDEAQDYFDRNIGLILAQARKQNTGMILAHQFIGQLDPKLQEAVSANTAIKFAGGVSAKDARTMAPMLYCEPSLIEAQPKGSFVAYVKGATKGGVPLQFPFGYMEQKPQMDQEQRNALQAKMRERYAVHVSEINRDDEVEEAETAVEEEAPLDQKQPPKKDGGGSVNTEPGSDW